MLLTITSDNDYACQIVGIFSGFIFFKHRFSHIYNIRKFVKKVRCFKLRTENDEAFCPCICANSLLLSFWLEPDLPSRRVVVARVCEVGGRKARAVFGKGNILFANGKFWNSVRFSR